MPRPPLEVADVFRRYGETFRKENDASLSTAQRRVMSAIEVCRTAALGGHRDQCDHCAHEHVSYNSCRNRHCPKCQSLERAEWIEKRHAELLDCQYFHVVFTVPEDIASIAFQNKEVVYGILFRTAAETLRTIAADPNHLGAEIGFFSVLTRGAAAPLYLSPDKVCISLRLWSMGTEPAPSSSSALRRSRRRSLIRRRTLDLLPPRFLPAGTRTQPPVSPLVS